MAKKKTYDSSSIKVIKDDLKRIQKRPTMYIGALGSQGVQHLLKELIDNAVDEKIAGHCSLIKVRISNKRGIVVVQDNGRGIPNDNLEKFKSLFSTLHSSGKFDKESYTNSSGLNGVGLTCVNALSSNMSVDIKKGGKVTRYLFNNGHLKDHYVIKKIKKSVTGTVISFHPDPTFMEFETEGLGLVIKEVKEYLKMVAYINSGMKIIFVDEDTKKKKTYKFDDGLKSFIDEIADGKKKYIDMIKLSDSKEFKVILKGEKKKKSTVKVENIEGEVAFTYVNSTKEEIKPFCNALYNKEGGTHVTGFKMGLITLLKKYIKDNNILTKNDGVSIDEITGDDTREGIIAIVVMRHSDPKYSSQTKLNITNKNAQTFVQGLISEKLGDLFEENKNLARTICKIVIKNAIARKAGRKAKEQASKKVESSGLLSLNTKLSDCTSKDRSQAELWLVEGDSAGGSAKQARDNKTQAIFPFRGKIRNVHSIPDHVALKNKEIADLITILGCGFGKDTDLSKLRYKGGIVLMMDADSDGEMFITRYHIMKTAVLKFLELLETP